MVVTVDLFTSPGFQLMCYLSDGRESSLAEQGLPPTYLPFMGRVCVWGGYHGQFFTGYFPNEVSFSRPPVLAWERGPSSSSSLQRETARTCVCLLLILRMREKALIAGASFDPQQMKTKKHLSYLESPLLLSLSVSVSRLIPRLAAQTTCNIGQ